MAVVSSSPPPPPSSSKRNIPFTILTGIFGLWVVRNLVVYFVIGLLNPSQGKQSAVDELTDLLTPYLSPNYQHILDHVADSKTAKLYDERKVSVFLHVGITQVFAICGLYNLYNPGVGFGSSRSSGKNRFHVASGQMYMACVMVLTLTIIPLVVNAKEGPIMTLNEYIVASIVIGFAYKGYYDIKYHEDYVSHRSSMIMSSSGMFNLFLRRPLVVVFHALFVPTTKDDYFTYDYYNGVVWGGTTIAALLICQGIAIYIAYFKKTSPSGSIQNNSYKKRE